MGTPICSPLRIHCLLSLKTSLHCPLLSTPAADFNDRSVEQLARLSAEALRLHLASRYSRTSRPKANMAKRLYDQQRFESIGRHQQQQQCLTLASPTINSHWKSSPFDEPVNNDKLVNSHDHYPPLTVLQAKLRLVMRA